jgi:MerR family transcriptional regulator, copper efflux regulator
MTEISVSTLPGRRPHRAICRCTALRRRLTLYYGTGLILDAETHSTNCMGPQNTIGQVARGAGVGVETVRFYEREGLITSPPRPSSGYRDYPPDTVARIRFIRRAKDLGFSLAEVAGLLALSARAATECDDVRQRAETKIADIDGRIRDLRAVRDALSRLASDCVPGRPAVECPILNALRASGEADSRNP